MIICAASRCLSVSDLENKGLRRPSKRIIWVSSLLLDRTLHKTSRIQILEHLAQRGHETYLIAMHSREKPSLANSRIRVISFPMRYVPLVSPALYIMTLLFVMPLLIAAKKPDFIITEPEEQLFAVVPSVILFPAKKFKCVLDIRSTPVSSLRNEGTLGYLKAFNFAICVQLSKRLFNGMTVITSLMKEEVCRRFRLDPKKVGVWVDGVSKELFKREKYDSDRARIRSRFNVSDKFVLFYHGTFDKDRGLTESIESMQFVKSNHPDVVLFMLGTGPLRQQLVELVKAKQLDDNVIFHSPVKYEEVPKYIAISDVGLVPLPNLPYWKNQCPLNLIEYLAMEKPVILTNIPANHEIVGDKDCGIYTSCHPVSIATSVDYAYSNRSKLELWGESGRIIVESKYNWESASLALEDYLLSLEQKLNRTIPHS